MNTDSSLESWPCVCAAPKHTTHKLRASPPLNIARAGKTSDLKCSMLFIYKRLRWRVLNSSTKMITTSTSSEEDSCSPELLLKRKKNVDLNVIPANQIAAMPQQQRDRNHKDRKHGHTPWSVPSLSGEFAGERCTICSLESWLCCSSPKQTTQWPCAFTLEKSARVEKDTQSQVLSVARHLELIVTDSQTTVNKTDTFHTERLLKTQKLTLLVPDAHLSSLVTLYVMFRHSVGLITHNWLHTFQSVGTQGLSQSIIDAARVPKGNHISFCDNTTPVKKYTLVLIMENLLQSKTFSIFYLF